MVSKSDFSIFLQINGEDLHMLHTWICESLLISSFRIMPSVPQTEWMDLIPGAVVGLVVVLYFKVSLCALV